MENIGHIIAVMSGKGGVGKTTVSVNLAAALSKMSYQVGIFDADVTGPNVVRAIGAEGGQFMVVGDRILPYKTKDGIAVASMALLVGEGIPIVWRGPLKTRAIQQLMDQVDWRYLDYLVVDLPPGTSDEPLTIMQSFQLDGVVIVTTPQRLALMDVERAINMVKKMGIRVLGIVENMSYFICPGGQEVPMFGGNWTEEVSKKTKVPILGRIPFDPLVAELTDEGKPVVLERPETKIALEFLTVATNIVKIVEKTEEKQKDDQSDEEANKESQK